VCFFRHFVESNREFVVHVFDQGPYVALVVLATPSHAQMPITHDLVDTRISCPRQSIDRDRNIIFSFCDVTNLSNLLASEFDFLKNCVFAEDLIQSSGDIKFGDA
jgi:hypothetical protein